MVRRRFDPRLHPRNPATGRFIETIDVPDLSARAGARLGDRVAGDRATRRPRKATPAGPKLNAAESTMLSAFADAPASGRGRMPGSLATARSLAARGLLEERTDRRGRTQFRITDAGRSAAAKTQQPAAVSPIAPRPKATTPPPVPSTSRPGADTPELRPGTARPPAPTFDAAKVAAAVRGSASRGQADAQLARLTSRQLHDVAAALGIALPGRATLGRIRAAIAAARGGDRRPSSLPGPADTADLRVRRSLREAATVEEVSAVIAAEARRITGHDVDVDLRGSDVQLAREHGEGILLAMQHAPDTRVRAIYTYGPGGARPAGPGGDSGEYANAAGDDGQSIGFAMGWVTDPVGYRASIARDAARRGGIRGSVDGGPIGIAIHEFGHVASDQASRRPGHGRAPSDLELDALHHARAVTRRTPGGAGGDVAIQALTSFYATTDAGELVAEAFADVVMNGDRASALSHEIYAMITGRPGRPTPPTAAVAGRGRRRPRRGGVTGMVTAA